VRGLILKINSPGGSAAEAEAIYDAIMRFKKEHGNIPVYAVPKIYVPQGVIILPQPPIKSMSARQA